MKRVLIIGGSAFVGLAVVRAFLQGGCEVAVLNRGNNPIDGTHQLTADRNDITAFRSAIGARTFDVVIDTNCYRPQQARILCEAVEGRTANLLMISSASVYADDAAQPPSEEEPLGGASVWGDYGRDKYQAERVFLEASPSFKRISILRPPYVFGPGNNLDRERWFWSRLVAGSPIILPRDGNAAVQFIHEDDLGAAICFLGDQSCKGRAVFNIADRQILSLSGLTTMLAEVAGVADRQIKLGNKFSNVPARKWFPFRDYPCLAEPSRLYATGWAPRSGLRARFAETFRALKDQIPAPTLSSFEQEICSSL